MTKQGGVARNVRGVLGTKLGMTQVFDGDGKIVPVTVVSAGPCVVTAVRGADSDGYAAVQLGFGEVNPRKVTKPVAGIFAKAGVTPRRYLVELRTSDAAEYTLGQEVTAETFEAGELVDVTATSKGKGFAGVMKRHGFHGLSSSHGTQRKHRSPGSIGGCAFPGHVFKGQKMAGRMGGQRTTLLNDPACRRRRQGPAADQGRGSRSGRRPGPSAKRRQESGWRADTRGGCGPMSPASHEENPEVPTQPEEAAETSATESAAGEATAADTAAGETGTGETAAEAEPAAEAKPARRRAAKAPAKKARAAVKSTEVKVDMPAEIFGATVNVPLIHQVVVAQQAAARQGTHATKTRGEVRGGGRKPYRQKGTGRARQGSVRAPQFAGGGVAGGPVSRSHAQKTPKKMKAAALRGALSDRARHGLVQVVSGFVDGEPPKTALAVSVLSAVTGVAAGTSTVLVVADRSDQLTWKSLNNASGVKLIDPGQLNTYDVLTNDRVVFTAAAYESFVARAGAQEER